MKIYWQHLKEIWSLQCIPPHDTFILPILPVSYLRLQLGLVIFYDKQVFSKAPIFMLPMVPAVFWGLFYTIGRRVQRFFFWCLAEIKFCSEFWGTSQEFRQDVWEIDTGGRLPRAKHVSDFIKSPFNSLLYRGGYFEILSKPQSFLVYLTLKLKEAWGVKAMGGEITGGPGLRQLGRAWPVTLLEMLGHLEGSATLPDGPCNVTVCLCMWESVSKLR